jgi:hypothetical protein
MGAPRTTATSSMSATPRPPLPHRAFERFSPLEGFPQRALDRVSPFDEPFCRICLSLPFSAQGAGRRSIPTPDARDEPPQEPPLFE